MNPHMPGGPPMPPAVPMQHQSRRHQEYHQYQQHMPPRSPGPHNPYAQYYLPPYYQHPNQMPYPLQRWPSHQSYSPYPMHPAHAQYPPRSPMVVSSQPHSQPTAPPPTCQPPFSHDPFTPQSPHPAAPPTPAASIPQSIPSPHDPPSKSSTPKPVSRRSSIVTQPPPQPQTRMPFYPELPCFFPPDARDSFPSKAAKRRKQKQTIRVANDVVTLPSRTAVDSTSTTGEEHPGVETEKAVTNSTGSREVAAISDSILQDKSAITPVQGDTTPKAVTPTSHARRDTRTAIPILPAVPGQSTTQQRSMTSHHEEKVESTDAPAQNGAPDGTVAQEQPPLESDQGTTNTESPSSAPKSWADLVRSKNQNKLAASSLANGTGTMNGVQNSRATTMSEVLTQYSVDSAEKVAFLEPRGLVNTGNMCYMNAILQILVFCVPFYDFLDQVGKRAAHSFKSDTPLVDAMIMFMREFKIIDSAESADKLRMRLKDGELERYGDSFIPEYVYDVIKSIPRFSSMRRGHQQDAEEFLGFLLAGLHDECVSAMKRSGVAAAAANDTVTSPTSTTSQNADGWLEVGPRQKAAVTRQAGDSSTPSPLTRIFEGALRSELRVPGLKNSVTLEPYQPLQLDIGAVNVNNITDALKAITKPETLTGDFNSPRGPGTSATKQVFIESLPPVLILHLKRFQYDSSGGTQKIWKRVGYPLELEIPKEVLPPAKRGGLAVKGGSPKYRLTSVVYHHGKSAAGGHYTADLLRQDRREWIRIDDTIIRRIRAEDVAEGGSEEDPKVLAKALEQHKADEESSKRNLFEGLDGDDNNTDDGRSWNEVNGVDGKKKWAGVAASAGTATPSTAGKRTPRRENVKDNKVAYILLYERISG